ncbi:hypothetical protein C8J56DRAFT_1049885 [Mycena floridula]|nr:hypothetical protein C8J56DRAFT_1049885 [Mycena floridula]
MSLTVMINSQHPALPVPQPLIQTPTVIPSILWGAPYIDSCQTETSPIHMTSENFTGAFFQAVEDEDDGCLHITGVDMAALMSGLQAVIVQGVVEHDYSGLLAHCQSFLVQAVDGRFSPGDGIEETVSTLWSLYKLQPASSHFFKFCTMARHLWHCLCQCALQEKLLQSICKKNYLFESYLDTSVHVYHSRTERSHQLLTCELLYKCVIGREPPLHPELQALSKEFRLGRANGFDFTTNLFDDMSLHVFFTAPRALEDEITMALDFEPPFHCETFIKTFPQGIGIPDHSEWDNVKPMFNDYLPLDTVNEPWFWPHMFLWALELRAAILKSDQDITVQSFSSLLTYGNSNIDTKL